MICRANRSRATRSTWPGVNHPNSRAASERTGAEPGHDIAPVGGEEVAVSVGDHPATRRPRTAAQYLARAEPWCRVVFIGIRRETGEGFKSRGGPFPHITEHLPAPPGAVASGKRRNVDDADDVTIQIGPM